MLKIGIISDTHGLLRPEAETVLEGLDHIIHAGDIGHPHIVPRLRHIAPVTAIRGNVDTADGRPSIRSAQPSNWKATHSTSSTT